MKSKKQSHPAETRAGESPGRRGPSMAALAALVTLAAALWLEVELSAALFRSVLVYLGVSLLVLLYRAVLAHYLRLSQERAEREFLEKIQREAEASAQAHAAKESLNFGAGATPAAAKPARREPSPSSGHPPAPAPPAAAVPQEAEHEAAK